MKKKRNKKSLPTRFSLYGLTGVCLVVILLSLVLNISGGPLNAVAGYVFVPMQSGINSCGLWLSRQTDNLKSRGTLAEENRKLKEEVEELSAQLTTMKMDQYELDTYRKLMDLDEKYSSYQKVAATVIAKDSGNWFSVFTINKGTQDGLEAGMNVIAGGGLVGLITDVGPNYAQVRSIIDDTSNVSAMIPSTGDNFNVSGNLQTMGENQVITFREMKDDENEVQIGDAVVTSYVSDCYQQGILIGYITSIEENANHLTKSGTITPVVDFEHLTHVLVITHMKESDEESGFQTQPSLEDSKQPSTEDSTEISSEQGAGEVGDNDQPADIDQVQPDHEE